MLEEVAEVEARLSEDWNGQRGWQDEEMEGQGEGGWELGLEEGGRVRGVERPHRRPRTTSCAISDQARSTCA